MAKGLWQPPRLRLETEEEQKTSWLELFYDLIFVVAIAQLAHYLSAHTSLVGFLSFVALFFPLWWCWLGTAFYDTRFHTDDLVDRLLTLLQMGIIAALAVNIHHGLAASSGFALCYAAYRIVLIVQYLMAGYHVAEARELTIWFGKGFTLSVILWLLSLLLPAPWRFYLWGLAMMIDLATPFTARQLEAQLPLSIHHIPERLGLFTIIVLGESIASVVKGIGEQKWQSDSLFIAALSLLIAFSLWWVYFDNLDGSPLGNMKQGNTALSVGWVYSHLPLAIGIVGTSVGVEHLIINKYDALHSEDVWLFCGSLALCLLVLSLIHWIACVLSKKPRLKILSFYRLGAGIFLLILATAGTALSPLILVLLATVACTLQVVMDLVLHI